MPTLTLTPHGAFSFETLRCSSSLLCSDNLPNSQAASATLTPGVLIVSTRVPGVLTLVAH